MDRELHASAGLNSSNMPGGPQGESVIRAAIIGALTFVVLLGLGFAIGVFNSVPQNGVAQINSGVSQAPSTDIFNQLNLFHGWDRPALAIVLTGEQHGYLQPCGCSNPQYGGLVRRQNLIQELRKRAWPIVAADLGDVNQIKVPKNLPNVQGTLKYVYAMKAMDLMGYSAVNFGEYETRMPLTEATSNYALNNATPRIVSANLLRPPGSPFTNTIHDFAQVNNLPGPKVGILGLTGWSVEKEIKDPMVTFPNKQQNPQMLAKVLTQIKAGGADFIVLLYQGNRTEVKQLANHINSEHQKNAAFPAVDVIVCLSDDPQPPAMPLQFEQNRPMILQVGHKGLNVGVVGVYPGKGAVPFDLKYQLVAMGPEFDTPKGQEVGHKIMALMEEYTAQLKSDDYLGRYKPVLHPHQVNHPDAEYVGSHRCQNCHEHAFKIWKESPSKVGHSHAYDTLVKAKHPSNRQFDGECIVCHTVGFGYKSGFESYDKTKDLTDVGCESCHGPCSEHVARPNNNKLYAEINPWKWRDKNPPTQAQENHRQLKIDTFCQSCHDLDNDNNFQFHIKWPKVIHMTPPAGQK